MKKIESRLITMLDLLYDKCINGVKGFKSAFHIGNHYISKYDDVELAIKKVIHNHMKKSGTTGFISGLESIVFPISMPMNIATALFIQLRMVSTIAYLRGYDLYQEHVKYFVYLCLCGKKSTNILNEFPSIKEVSNEFSIEMLNRIKSATIIQLVSNLSVSGFEQVIEMIPVAGSIIGAGLNLRNSKEVADTALKIFGQI